MAHDNHQKSLKDKVSDWIQTEGYPLEFSVAQTFHKYGFDANQGQYVKDEEVNSLCEIDVLAQESEVEKDSLVRVCNVVECKWSRDKPWVIFTSRNNRIAESACIAQTISNKAGQAVLWAIAGDKKLWLTQMFRSPLKAGFNGRQVFGQKNDLFYQALQSVTRKSRLLVNKYDPHRSTPEELLRSVVIAFPLIVVDSDLFEAYLNPDVEKLVVEEADHLRMHWRGSPSWPLHATVDIVRKAKLDQFAEVRRKETDFLIENMLGCLARIQLFSKTGDLRTLKVKEGGRGIVGLPPLLWELRDRIKPKRPALTNKRRKKSN